jgi:single-strand DNA-binding protein
MRIAVNDRRKIGEEWQEVPGYYDVTVFGRQGENAARYLQKGSSVAIAGKLQWREWEHDGVKRQTVEILANEVQFVGGRRDAESSSEPQTEAAPW